MFGGFAPMPLRLGGGATDGLTAAQFSRLAADTISARRTLPFARLTVTRSSDGGASPVLAKWSCMAPETVDNRPTVTGNQPSAITITFPKAPKNFVDDAKTLKITGIRVSRINTTDGAALLQDITAPNIITIDPDGADACDFTVTVYGIWDQPRLDDYGASLDKLNADREYVPYAWTQYQELGAAIGSGFGTASAGTVHARKIALARALGAVYRSDERLRANSRPETAEALLGDWAKSLDVVIPAGEPAWKTRGFLGVMHSTPACPDVPSLEEACSLLLGRSFVGVTVFDEEGVGWPDAWDLGGGVWASARGKVLVDVAPPLRTGDPEFTDLVEVRLMRLLDRVTPAHTHFGWTIDSGGFFLDVSPLDYTGL